jgi:hypothetical protein
VGTKKFPLCECAESEFFPLGIVELSLEFFLERFRFALVLLHAREVLVALRLEAGDPVF